MLYRGRDEQALASALEVLAVQQRESGRQRDVCRAEVCAEFSC